MRVISKDAHQIDPKSVHSSAVNIVSQLKNAGFDAYVVGGAVRDLMLGGHPKDFDVATNATPEQVRGIFRSARIIGRRFQIVHVRQGRKSLKSQRSVATMKARTPNPPQANSRTKACYCVTTFTAL